MAIYIQNLHIHTFRGIRDLTAEHLNHINLIVGDNNCGNRSISLFWSNRPKGERGRIHGQGGFHAKDEIPLDQNVQKL